jgi:ABC-type multidrug transport system ATPase subunit
MTLRVEWPTREVGAPTRRSCDAASRFGLLLEEHANEGVRDAVRIGARANTATLFTGPSGAGKSTLLRASGEALRTRGVRVLALGEVRLGDRPAVDLLGGNIDDAMRLLARVGLGQAACFLRRAQELSDGQRWRLRLAVALDRLTRGGGHAALLIDECCAALDPWSALGACATIRRVVREVEGLRVLCASADPRVEGMLGADEVVRMRPGGEVRVERRPREREAAAIVVERGGMRDYASLASAHYRSNRPARPATVLVARLKDDPSGEVAGALVVAHPTLNSPVREIAWPGRYATRDRGANIRRVNREIRALARCVVDPRLRGLGIATELVRAYLRDPRTARTEAVGAMADVSGFLERAGMTRHELPIREPDARLLDALAHAGVEPWRLAQGTLALRRAIEGSSAAFVERELRAWANWGRAHRRWAGAPLEELFLRACRFAACRPVGFTHERS